MAVPRRRCSDQQSCAGWGSVLAPPASYQAAALGSLLTLEILDLPVLFLSLSLCKMVLICTMVSSSSEHLPNKEGST